MAKLRIIGIGPGGIHELTSHAKIALDRSEKILGYDTYIDLLRGLYPEEVLIGSPMRDELRRVEEAIDLVESGHDVALISSGDAGIYGMAGVVLELLAKNSKELDLEIVPGITAVSAAAGLLGAPLMNDFAVISLSDLLTPKELILKRVRAAARGDFVIGLYNPKSQKRIKIIEEARDILLEYYPENTPVGIVTAASRLEEERVVITTLGEMLNQEINMRSVVIVGNSKSFVYRDYMITPRGYEI